MPILMIALMALAVFGGIGFLLAAAVVLEHRKKILSGPEPKSAGLEKNVG